MCTLQIKKINKYLNKKKVKRIKSFEALRAFKNNGIKTLEKSEILKIINVYHGEITIFFITVCKLSSKDSNNLLC